MNNKFENSFHTKTIKHLTRCPWATSLKNTNDYIITLIKRRKKHYLLYENLMVLHLNKLELPSSKDASC